MTITKTELNVLEDMARVIHDLQTQVKALESQVKGHKSHTMDILVPSACDDGATCDDRKFETTTFGERRMRVSHSHNIDATELAKRYPASKRPELWTMEPNTQAVRALLPRAKVQAIELCGNPFLVVS